MPLHNKEIAFRRHTTMAERTDPDTSPMPTMFVALGRKIMVKRENLHHLQFAVCHKDKVCLHFTKEATEKDLLEIYFFDELAALRGMEEIQNALKRI